jgi:glycosyltransferase involved in cell wall biosynthesis
VSPTGRPLLFYSWALGFYTPEAERKAIALSEAGYDVVHVAGIGIRNPGLSNARKALRTLGEKLRHRSGTRETGIHPNLATASVFVLPPRQLAPMRRFNGAWLGRQLRDSIDGWDEALAWIRFPTPELVDALTRSRPARVVYECVDAYDELPLTRGKLVGLLRDAERALVAEADLVVVSSEALGERMRSLGAAEVRVIPHGVDVGLFAWPPQKPPEDGPTTIGFVGTLDFRLDIPALRHVAERHPDWRIRLIGPIGDIFDPRRLSDLPNISVEPPVPHERVGEVIAGFNAGIMPYVEWPGYRYTVPVKNLEYMAAGKPAVVRPSPALRPNADLVYFAKTPQEYSAQLERGLREDSAALAERRRAVAEANTWERRLGEIQAVAKRLATP